MIMNLPRLTSDTLLLVSRHCTRIWKIESFLGREVVENERIFRFEFPERPGALHLFLNKLTSGDRHDQGNFNVSLFHYRNHGADIGRVLVGIQVAPHESEQFERFLKELEFVYKEETDNPAYRDFLQ